MQHSEVLARHLGKRCIGSPDVMPHCGLPLLAQPVQAIVYQHITICFSYTLSILGEPD